MQNNLQQVQYCDLPTGRQSGAIMMNKEVMLVAKKKIFYHHDYTLLLSPAGYQQTQISIS